MDSTLDDRIQGLPRELQLEILELAVSVKADQTVAINKSYKLPLGLQVTRATREKTATAYYSTILFTEDTDALITRSLDRWLKHIPDEHLVLLRKIRRKLPKPECPTNQVEVEARLALLDAWEECFESGVDGKNGVLQIELEGHGVWDLDEENGLCRAKRVS